MSSEWRPVTLGDLMEVRHGWPFKSEFFETNESASHLPIVVAIGNFEYSGGFRFQSTQIKRYTDTYPAEYKLEPGDILLVMTCQTAGGEILGIPARVPRDANTYLHNQRLGKVVLKSDEASLKYLYWLFLHPSFNRHLVGSATGTKILHTAPARIESFKFLLPPFVEQECIAATLGALEDRITLLRETNATLEAIAHALFKSWFVDFDPVRAKMEGRVPEGMDEATAALFPDSFEETELGVVPRGWQPTRLDSFIELAYGKALKAEARRPGAIPVYGSGGVTGWHDEALVHGPSIIVGRKGTVGSLYWESRPFYPIDTVFYVCSTRPLSYCYELLKTLGLSDMNTDAAVPGLNRENAYRLLVPNPPAPVINAFNETVQALRWVMDHNAQQSAVLESVRDTLLPRLISGQLRVPDAQSLTE